MKLWHCLAAAGVTCAFVQAGCGWEELAGAAPVGELPGVAALGLRGSSPSPHELKALAAAVIRTVEIPPGSFQMGSDPNEAGHHRDEKLHTVQITHPFAIMRTEVSRGAWQALMGEPPPAGCKTQSLEASGPSTPVFCVTWFDALRFANRLSERSGLEPCYQLSRQGATWKAGLSCGGYRLPTEAEWEYVARLAAGAAERRAGTHNYSRIFGTGGLLYSGLDQELLLMDRRLEPVTQDFPDKLGLHFLYGNVWEWTWDYYGEYRAGEVVDPLGAAHGSRRSLRGGSWLDSAHSYRPAARGWLEPTAAYGHVGFRLVRSLQTQAPTPLPVD